MFIVRKQQRFAFIFVGIRNLYRNHSFKYVKIFLKLFYELTQKYCSSLSNEKITQTMIVSYFFINKTLKRHWEVAAHHRYSPKIVSVLVQIKLQY
jgi:hypothetical protein